jgi:predicted secreted hydrolase
MTHVLSRKLRGAALVCAAAVACALAIPRVSSASTDNGGGRADPQSAAAAGSGSPTFVHLPADQAAHHDTETEWWYTVGHLSSHGHQYGYEVQLMTDGKVQLSVTDVTAGKYYMQSLQHQPGQYSVSYDQLDVRMPNAALSGPINDMHLTASLPEGSLDLHLNAKGPVMYGNGTGLFPFLGRCSYYYSLPELQTTGTLTLDGTTSQVAGISWLDRQWGSSWDWTVADKWTWMAIQLGNDEYINLWDMFTDQGEQQWATVLHHDGSQSIVPVNPLADHATDFETSPETGQRYAGKWTVEIPSLNAWLTVKATPTLQEVEGGQHLGPNEAASTVAGLYQGIPVIGQAYVEQFGLWR